MFMHQQQHYTLFKMKKVKSQSTTPLKKYYKKKIGISVGVLMF